MSDILTGPDRGPPAFDWRKKAVQLQAELDALALRFSEETEKVQRLRGLLNEAQQHITNAPMSLRAYASPDTLNRAIERALKDTL